MEPIQAVTQVCLGRDRRLPVIDLAPSKSWPIRFYTLERAGEYVLATITTQRKPDGREYTAEYLVEIERDGSVMFAKQSENCDVYEVKEGQCNCCGSGRHGGCKHIDVAESLLSLIG